MMSANELKKKPEDHIKFLFESNAKNDNPASMLASTLESIIYTAFKGEHKYIFELLQNADDSAELNEKIEIKFNYIPVKDKNDNHFLIFSHNGKHFSSEDVEKISNNAQSQYGKKIKDNNKIGYKGIGFKAIFSIADRVYILSRAYSFRFDKHYQMWKSSPPGRAFPWPVIPIWTSPNEIPGAIKALLNPDEVNFIIQLRPGESPIQDLNFIIDNPAIMLYLRNVRKIEVNDGHKRNSIVLNELADFYQLFVNNKINSNWIRQEYIFNIPESIQQILQSLSHHECPERMKLSNTTKISFAAQLDEKESVVKMQDSCLYTYLPTQLKLGLPYLVNADFLLNADRTRLIENAWNEFLLRTIPFAQFIWLADLTKNQKFRYQILKLLSSSTISTHHPQFNSAFENGYEAGIHRTPFIPMHDSNELATIDDLGIDSTEFYKEIKQVKPPGVKGLADYSLENIEIIENRKEIKKIGFKELCATLSVHASRNLIPSFQLQILNFLFNIPHPQRKNSRRPVNWQEELKNIPFLLTNNNKIETPAKLYFETKDSTSLDIPSEFALSFIHPELAQNSMIRKGLISIGVKEATPIELVRGFIFQLIRENKITLENVIYITHYIFDVYLTRVLQESDWEKLRHLPVLNKNNQLQSATNSYLANRYLPALAVEEMLSADSFFVSENYLMGKYTNAGSSKLKDWNSFFTLLGVHSNVKFSVLLQYPISRGIKDYPDNFASYLTYLSSNGMIKSINYDLHRFEQFIDCNLLKHIHNPGFAKVFWQQLFHSWSLIKPYTTTRYLMGRGDYLIDTPFIQYVLKKTACFPILNSMYMTSQVYSSKLCEYNAIIPVMDLGMEITDEQADFFGFKTTLEFNDCFELLKKLNRDNVTDPKKYATLLRCLLDVKLAAQQIAQLQSWQGNLPAQDGSLQKITRLSLYAVKNKSAPANSKSFLREFSLFDYDERVTLSKWFGIAIFDESQLRFTTVPPTNELKEDLQIKQLIQEKLLFIVTVDAHHKTLNESDLLSDFLKKIEKLRFFSAHRMTQNGPNKEENTPLICYLDNNNHFYFKNSWHNSSTITQFCLELGSYLQLHANTQILLRQLLESDDCKEILKENNYSSDVNALTKVMGSLSINSASPFEIKEDIALSRNACSPSLLIANANINTTFASTEFKATEKQTSVSAHNKSDSISSPPFIDNSYLVNVEHVVMSKQFPLPSTKKSACFSPASVSHIAGTHRSRTSNLSNDDKTSIGRYGENIVYNKLKYHYKLKYPKTILVETTDGFECNGQDNNNEILSLKVIWHNKNQDTSEPRDFTIIKNGVERVIEVKTTRSLTSEILHVSRNELNVMNTYKERYRFFRVYGAGSDNPRVEKIKNPAKLMQDNQLNIEKIEIRL